MLHPAFIPVGIVTAVAWESDSTGFKGDCFSIKRDSKVKMSVRAISFQAELVKNL